MNYNLYGFFHILLWCPYFIQFFMLLFLEYIHSFFQFLNIGICIPLNYLSEISSNSLGSLLNTWPFYYYFIFCDSNIVTFYSISFLPTNFPRYLPCFLSNLWPFSINCCYIHIYECKLNMYVCIHMYS